MKDSRKTPLQPQVKRKRPVEFDLEPVVQDLLSKGICTDRVSAMLAVTATALKFFPHWTIADEPGRGLYAVSVDPKALARKARHDS